MKLCDTSGMDQNWTAGKPNQTCEVFAYGTLKPGEWAFARFCQPFLIEAIAAQVRGRLYHLPLGYPALTLEPGWVQGVLLRFPNADPLAAIDAFEDYYPDRPSDSEYQRQPQAVFGIDGRSLGTAWVYTMTCDRVVALGGQWLPEGIWSGQ